MKNILFVSTKEELTSETKKALEANFGEEVEFLIAPHYITDASVLCSKINLCDQIIVHTDSNCLCQQFTWLTDKPIVKMTVKGQKIMLNPVVKIMSVKDSYNTILREFAFHNADVFVTNTSQEMLELLNILEAHRYSVTLHNLKSVLHRYRRSYLDTVWMWDEDIVKEILKTHRFYDSKEERALEVYGDLGNEPEIKTAKLNYACVHLDRTADGYVLLPYFS